MRQLAAIVLIVNKQTSHNAFSGINLSRLKQVREHHFSGLDQVIHLVVSADLEPDPLQKSFANVGPDC